MKARLTRICIYPKDIQLITGKSERYSRDLILNIKSSLNKPEHQFLTVLESCTYMGIPYESIRELIVNESCFPGAVLWPFLLPNPPPLPETEPPSLR